MTNKHINNNANVSMRLEDSNLDKETERKSINTSFDNTDSRSSPCLEKSKNYDKNMGMTIPALVTLDSPASTASSTPSTPSSPCKEHIPHNDKNLIKTDKCDHTDHVKTEIAKADTFEVEVYIEGDELKKESSNDPKDDIDDDDNSVVMGPVEFFRKSIVAITGTAMLGVGACLVPAPVPLGVPVMIGAVAILNAEFPETVNGVKEDARKKLVEVLEKDDANDNITTEDQSSSEKLSIAENDDKGCYNNINDKEKTLQKFSNKNTLQASIEKKTQEFKRGLRSKVLPWLKKDEETSNEKI